MGKEEDICLNCKKETCTKGSCEIFPERNKPTFELFNPNDALVKFRRFIKFYQIEDRAILYFALLFDTSCEVKEDAKI